MSKDIIVNIDGGYLRATKLDNEDFQGIDIEFVAENDKGNNASRPRVSFEQNKEGELRVLLWTDKNQEEYTEEFIIKDGRSV